MKKRMGIIWVLFLFYTVVSGQATFSIQIDAPCNVRLSDTAGNYYRPDSTYFWKTYMGTAFADFPCDGRFSLPLPVGEYHYELDRGPEYILAKGNFKMTDKDIHLDLKLSRIVNMKQLNWYSGDLHIHRKVKDIELLMKASDLHIAPVITSWNNDYPYAQKDSSYDFSTRGFDNDRYYTITGAEDERSGGAILVLNTAVPVNYSIEHKKEYPPLAKSVQDVNTKENDRAWIDIDKPFWWDMPIILATSKINSIGIAHNHMNQGGVHDNEAWGVPRNKIQYPPPMGNGYWTQELYYRVLNSGFRILPSAGGASGVLPNPVGYNRQYVYVAKELTYNKWFEALKKGRTFVTNGPLLLCKADGQLPGTVFSSRKKMQITITGSIQSRDSIESIELIRNGKVDKRLSAANLSNHQFSTAVDFDKSGWFLVRVICRVPDNFRFASTAPFYVEIGKEKKRISKSAALFFYDWVNTRSDLLKWDNPRELEEINRYLHEAKIFWKELIGKANAE